MQKNVIGIIGGADGPTTIIVRSNYNITKLIFVLTSSVLVCVSLIFFVMKKRKK